MSDSNNNDDSVSIYWFRNALRFHDNPSLLHATTQSARLLPLYIIDPSDPFAQTPGRPAGCIRANFVLETLVEMDRKLQDMGSQLFVLQGDPSVVLPDLCQVVHATNLYYERDPAAPVRTCDSKVLAAIRDRYHHSRTTQGTNFQIKGFDTHTLHPMERYLALCKGEVAPATYGGFTKIFNKLKPVPEEAESVQTLPPLPDHLDRIYTKFGKDLTPPTLEQLGYDTEELVHRHKGGIDFVGGEDAGLALLDRMMKRTDWVCKFEKPNTSPNALVVDTTGLSPCELRNDLI
jgi:cryptochrome